MASKTLITLVDDLDGTEIPNGNGETVLFALDGADYEIDLTNGNAVTLRDVLSPYLANGRKVSKRPTKPSAAKPTTSGGRTGPDPAAVRAWATFNGVEVGERGRIPKVVVEAYLQDQE